MADTPVRLLVLQDSRDFGGHELMFLRLLPAILASADVGAVLFCFPEGNRKLKIALERLASPKLEIRTWPYAKRPGEPYLAGARFRYRAAVLQLLRIWRPDVALLVQGRIEHCAVPTLAFPRGLRLLSYLPMAHSMPEMGRSPIGDRVRRRLYRRPDRFIVPSEAVADQAVRAGARRRPIVVENQVSPPPRQDRPTARSMLGLPRDRRIALFLGRLDVKQKGLDRLCEALLRDAEKLADWTFLFVGSGEGQQMLVRLRERSGDRLDVQLVGWSDAPHQYLAAADILLMPSRWEGVPLVMLEAMTYGLPLLASRIDVFEEYLPAACLFDFASGDLASALEDIGSVAFRAAFEAEASERLGHRTATAVDQLVSELTQIK